MKVYVAGASHELERCELAIKAVQNTRGLTVTHDWTLSVRESGVGNEGALSIAHQRRVAAKDLDGVRVADVLWYLAPDGKSEGSSLELGFALALRLVKSDPHIVISGKVDTRIFCSFPWLEKFATDEMALARIARLACGGGSDER